MAKDATLERIDRKLGALSDRLERLEQAVDRIERGSPSKNGSVPRRELLGFLDRFRAGEALGEASTGAWIAVSTTECVRGGLRTVQCREGMHARLLEQRIKELGGSTRHEIPDDVVDKAMRQAGDPRKSDAEKLADFVARFGDVDEALRPIHALADRLDDDPETQSLLRTIAQDERSTLEFFCDACAQLNPA